MFYSLAICKGWSMFQHYVNNEFLYVDFVKDVYMTLPLDLRNKNETKVWKPIKSLYGLNKIQNSGMENSLMH